MYIYQFIAFAVWFFISFAIGVYTARSHYDRNINSNKAFLYGFVLWMHGFNIVAKLPKRSNLK